MVRFSKIRSIAIGVIVLSGTGFAASKVAWNWGTTEEGREVTEFTQSKAVCKRLGAPMIPRVDRPNPAQSTALKACNAESLYYGFEKAPDYVKARHCAILELETAQKADNFFSGPAILMQIYANGQGVARNLDLATALACSIESAPAENDGRVLHLQALKSKSETKPFDICDDITSGFAGGWCRSRDSVFEAVKRDRRIATSLSRLQKPAQSLFGPAKAALEAFAESRSGTEIDLTGTLRDAFVIEAKDAEFNRFAEDITLLAKAKWPRATQKDAEIEDKDLNARYKKALVCVNKPQHSGTVHSDGIKQTQRLWLKYRDTFIPFALKAASGLKRDAIAARLTDYRAKELSEFCDD